MNSTIGVYATHSAALKAIDVLAEANYPVNQLSLIGKTEIIDDQIHVKSSDGLVNTAIGVSVGIGSVLGVLTGVGVVAIPGFGFLLGIGAIIGGIAGFDLGLIGGEIIALLSMFGIKKEHAVKFHEHLKEGKFLVVAHGTQEEIEKAHEILNTHGEHLELNIHSGDAI